MKLRNYLLYLFLFIALIGALINWLPGGVFEVLIDLISGVYIISFLLLANLLQGDMRKIPLYFKAVFTEMNDKKINERACVYFGSMIAYSVGAGVLGLLLGFIMAMVNLEDTASLGPNLAFSALTLLYGVLITLLLFLPFKRALESRLS